MIMFMFTEVHILYCVLATERARKFGLNFGLLCQTFIYGTFMLIHIYFTAVAFQSSCWFVMAINYLDLFRITGFGILKPEFELCELNVRNHKNN